MLCHGKLNRSGCVEMFYLGLLRCMFTVPPSHSPAPLCMCVYSLYIYVYMSKVRRALSYRQVASLLLPLHNSPQSIGNCQSTP